MRTPDALTWLVAAVLLTRVRLKARVRSATEEPSMLRDLREGWGVFTGQTWLWVVVAGFGSPGCSAFSCSGAGAGPRTPAARRHLDGRGLRRPAGVEVFSIGWSVAVQENIDERLLSRAYSYDILGSLVATPVGQIVYGPLGEAFGYRDVLVVSGVVHLIVVCLVLSSRSVRDLRRSPVTQAG